LKKWLSTNLDWLRSKRLRNKFLKMIQEKTSFVKTDAERKENQRCAKPH
jgi:hypothetical protein